MRAFARLSLVSLSVLAVTYLGCGASSDKSGGDQFSPSGDDAGGGDDSGSGDDGGGLGADVGGLGGEGGVGTFDLTVDPINAVVYIDTGKTPLVGGTQTFKVTQSGTDVSSTTTFTLEDPSLGTFAGNVFTSVTTLGKDSTGADVLGKTTVADALDSSTGKKGQAKITVVKLRKTEDPTTSARDFFFTMPYKAAPDPKDDVLKFTTNIQSIDVAFVTDTTGSMGGEISNISSNLSSTIIPGLKAAIPSVGIAIVDQKDVPIDPYGDPALFGLPADWPAKVLAPITVQSSPAALTTVQNAVKKYSATGGNDVPEAQIPAMYYTLTGKGFKWSGGGLADVTPAAGTTGAVGFRSGAVPVLVEISDASFHNGVASPYAASDFTAPNLTQLEDAFNKANAKFVGVYIDLGGGDTPVADMNALSDATKSNLDPSVFGGTCKTGLGGAAVAAVGGRCRLNFAAKTDGTGVSTSIVTAIKALASGSVYDILPVVANDPTNPGGVDATIFIDRLEGFADMSMNCAGTPRKSTASKTYNDMVGGITAGKQTACFKVIPKENDTVPPQESAQFFKAFINMKGIAPGADVTPTTPQVDLGDQRVVLFMVPPSAPGVK